MELEYMFFAQLHRWLRRIMERNICAVHSSKHFANSGIVFQSFRLTNRRLINYRMKSRPNYLAFHIPLSDKVLQLDNEFCMQMTES